ncbi:ribosomal RNA small subunit methyltransferase A [Candidatus Bathyarchaeota archaeon]|nr:MAG: ribosomal RNA small subunit methyltransferase A [Candidatus Bathyarchaeota archaeon]
MTLLNETKRLLRRYRIIPKKRLGQNFLVDEEILHKMVAYAHLNEEDTVLEIGAGLGFLTEKLAEKAERVIAVEIDDKLVRVLRKRLRAWDNVTILHGDIMKVNLPDFNKVVSTPPYSISSPLQFWLLDRSFNEAILSFQEEFARRLTAPVKSKDYGRLTGTTYYRADVEVLDVIPKESFWPPPKVDSLIVRLKPRKPPFKVIDEEIFFDVVRAIFTQKNKKIRNAIIPFFSRFRLSSKEAKKIADSLPFHDKRPRGLSPEEIGLIADEIVRKLQKIGLL